MDISECYNLDKIIDNIDFDEKQRKKLVDQESHVIEALKLEIQCKSEAVKTIEKESLQYEEETARLHQQYLRNVSACDSLKIKYHLLQDHENRLHKERAVSSANMAAKIKDLQSYVAKYRGVWNKYKAQYEQNAKWVRWKELEKERASTKDRLQRARRELDQKSKAIKDFQGCTTKEQWTAFVIKLAEVMVKRAKQSGEESPIPPDKATPSQREREAIDQGSVASVSPTMDRSDSGVGNGGNQDNSSHSFGGPCLQLQPSTAQWAPPGSIQADEEAYATTDSSNLLRTVQESNLIKQVVATTDQAQPEEHTSATPDTVTNCEGAPANDLKMSTGSHSNHSGSGQVTAAGHTLGWRGGSGEMSDSGRKVTTMDHSDTCVPMTPLHRFRGLTLYSPRPRAANNMPEPSTALPLASAKGPPPMKVPSMKAPPPISMPSRKSQVSQNSLPSVSAVPWTRPSPTGTHTASVPSPTGTELPPDGPSTGGCPMPSTQPSKPTLHTPSLGLSKPATVSTRGSCHGLLTPTLKAPVETLGGTPPGDTSMSTPLPTPYRQPSVGAPTSATTLSSKLTSLQGFIHTNRAKYPLTPHPGPPATGLRESQPPGEPHRGSMGDSPRASQGGPQVGGLSSDGCTPKAPPPKHTSARGLYHSTKVMRPPAQHSSSADCVLPCTSSPSHSSEAWAPRQTSSSESVLCGPGSLQVSSTPVGPHHTSEGPTVRASKPIFSVPTLRPATGIDTIPNTPAVGPASIAEPPTLATIHENATADSATCTQPSLPLISTPLVAQHTTHQTVLGGPSTEHHTSHIRSQSKEPMESLDSQVAQRPLTSAPILASTPYFPAQKKPVRGKVGMAELGGGDGFGPGCMPQLDTGEKELEKRKGALMAEGGQAGSTRGGLDIMDESTMGAGDAARVSTASGGPGHNSTPNAEDITGSLMNTCAIDMDQTAATDIMLGIKSSASPHSGGVISMFTSSPGPGILSKAAILGQERESPASDNETEDCLQEGFNLNCSSVANRSTIAGPEGLFCFGDGAQSTGGDTHDASFRMADFDASQGASDGTLFGLGAGDASPAPSSHAGGDPGFCFSFGGGEGAGDDASNTSSTKTPFAMF